jgi:hypothetical protein
VVDCCPSDGLREADTHFPVLFVRERIWVEMVGMSCIAPAKYPLLPSVFPLANIYSPFAVLRSRCRRDPLAVFYRSLATVLGLLLVVDTLEDCPVLSVAFSDYRKALGKSPVLKTLQSILRTAERLASSRGEEMGWRKGLGSCLDLRCKQRGHH